MRITRKLLAVAVLFLFMHLPSTAYGGREGSIHHDLSPIMITSEQDLIDMAIDQSWPGNGTEEQPFILENLTIDALNGSNCLVMHNIRSHLHIQNCTFVNTMVQTPSSMGHGSAVWLKNASNVTLEDIRISRTVKGIEIESSKDLDIFDINMDNVNENGLHAYGSRRVHVRYADVVSGRIGIKLEQIKGFSVDNCQVESGNITLWIASSRYGTISNSTIISWYGNSTLMNRSHHIKIASNHLSTYFNTGPIDGYALRFGKGSYNITIRDNTIKGQGLRLFEDMNDTAHIRSFLGSLVLTGDNSLNERPIVFIKDTDMENDTIGNKASMVIIFRSDNVIVDNILGQITQTTCLLVDSRNVRIFRAETYKSVPAMALINSSRISVSYSKIGYTGLGILVRGCSEVRLRSNEYSDCLQAIRIEDSTDVDLNRPSMTTYHGNSHGIIVEGSANVSISASNITLDKYPINVVGSSSVSISNNLFDEGSAPLLLQDTLDASVKNNTFLSDDTGILISGSQCARISDNQFKNCDLALLVIDSFRSDIAENIFEGTRTAIELRATNSSTVRINRFMDNGHALVMDSSVQDHVRGNLFLRGKHEAMELSGCCSVSVYRNSFIWNNGITNKKINGTYQVDSTLSSGISWYRMNEGNHWSDHASPYWDRDSDGIIDKPRMVDGGGAVDEFPLLFSPYPLLSAPLFPNCTSGRYSIDLEWQEPVSNIGNELLGYAIYRGTTPEEMKRSGEVDPDIMEYNDTSTYPGRTYYYGIRAINEYGEGSLSEITEGFTDPTGPEINIIHPGPGLWTNMSYIEVRWNGSDPESGIRGYLIRIDQKEWSVAGRKNSHLFSPLSDGEHLISIKAENSLGVISEEHVLFFVDTKPPVLSLRGGDEIYVNQPGFFLNWTADDEYSGVDGYRLKINNAGWSETFREDGTYLNINDKKTIVTIEVTDMAGNSRTYSLEVYYDTEPPELVSSYPEQTLHTNRSQVAIHWSFEDEGGIDRYLIRTEEKKMVLDWNIHDYLLRDLREGAHSIVVTAVDKAENHNSTVLKIVVDLTPPMLLDWTPVGDNVSTRTEIWMVSSEEIGIGTLTFTIEGMEGSIEKDQGRIFFRPEVGLEYGRTYRVVVTACDRAGNRMDHFGWTFRTQELAYIVGTILDGNGRGVKGALVRIEGHGSTLTNELGGFYLSVPPGSYELIIDANGFRRKTINVEAVQGETVDLSDINVEKEKSMLSTWFLIIAVAVVLFLVLMILLIMRRRGYPGEDEFYLDGEYPRKKMMDTDADEEFEIDLFEGAPNYYQLLNVEENATVSEIRSSYRKLAAMYHPDRMASRGEEMELDEVHDLIRDLNEAKTVLLNPLKRQMYDMSLLEREM
ncbi:MAG: NosD domain-containing protein [Thermoplasmatota archaeon]